MSKEVDELKVQVAAAWTCFDTLASEVETLKGQTVIHIGRALEKARAMKAQLQKTQALPSTTPERREGERMSREQEAISRLCLLVGICSVCAPKDNEPVQKLIKECVEWLNTPVSGVAQDETQLTDKERK